MKKSSAKNTCKVERNVTAVITYGNLAFDASTPEKELAIWKKVWKFAEREGWFVEKDGSWAAYAPIRVNEHLQEAYRAAKKGDIASMRILFDRRDGPWKLLSLRDTDELEIY